jgi:hypothetical protein
MNGVMTGGVVPARCARPETSAAENNNSARYYPALSYLRTFVVMLVVAHHAFLAYHPYAPAAQANTNFSSQPLLWTAFPIVDNHRWHGIDVFVGFNDIFFMSLMFFLSGLFVWPSLQRKGVGKFLSDRFLRLGLPFALGAAVLAPLAYYPSYRVTGADPGLGAFWKQWRSLGVWPSGPAWFIWVLLAFDCVAGVIYRIAPKFADVLRRWGSSGIVVLQSSSFS